MVKIPVMTVGSFDADSGEEVLREGKADLIGINRRFFADPDYPNKIREGRFGRHPALHPLRHLQQELQRAAVLPHQRLLRHRVSYDMAPLAKKKKVVVVGAGPSGMQAARVAAARGHDVTLYEKGGYLGGAVALAAMVKGLRDRGPARVPALLPHAGQEAWASTSSCTRSSTPPSSPKIKPDVVVVAAGGVPTLPDVPGIDGKNVIKTQRPLRHAEASTIRPGRTEDAPRRSPAIWMPVGKKVVIIGGAIQGCQLGEFLIKRGRTVTIVETGDELGEWLVPERKTRLFYWFDQKGVERLTGVKLVEDRPRRADHRDQGGRDAPPRGRHHHPGAALLAQQGTGREAEGQGGRGLHHRRLRQPGVIPDATEAGWRVGNLV